MQGRFGRRRLAAPMKQPATLRPKAPKTTVLDEFSKARTKEILRRPISRIPNPDISRAGRGGMTHGRAAGRGGAGRDADRLLRPGHNRASCTPGHRGQLSRTIPRKHEQAKSYVNPWGTKRPVDNWFIRGTKSALRSWLLTSGPTPFLSL